MLRKIMVAFGTLALLVSCMTAGVCAKSKSVKMTAYDEIIKSGNNVYCAGAEGLYKVTVDKSGAVTNKVLLHKRESMADNYSYFCGMKIKGKYLYSQLTSEGTPSSLVSVKLSTGKMKTLASDDRGAIKYAIKGSKIYYKPDHGIKKVMKLNGKSKKKTSVSPKMSIKKSNAKGYSVVMTLNSDESLITTYLITPAGKYKLGSHYGEPW